MRSEIEIRDKFWEDDVTELVTEILEKTKRDEKDKDPFLKNCEKAFLECCVLLIVKNGMSNRAEIVEELKKMFDYGSLFGKGHDKGRSLIRKFERIVRDEPESEIAYNYMIYKQASGNKVDILALLNERIKKINECYEIKKNKEGEKMICF